MSPSTLLSRTLLTTRSRLLSRPSIAAQQSHHFLQPLYPQIRHFTATMSKEGVHNLGSASAFKEALASNDKLIVLDCFATWCGPCKAIAPQIVKYVKSIPT